MENERPPFGLTLPKGCKTWKYDFRVDNQRYSRSTRKANLREAIKVAAKKHAEASGTAPLRAPRKPEITLDAAFDRFYEEKGHHDVDHDQLIVRLARIAERLGPHTFLSRVTMDDLLQYQTRRRRDGVANRTINADVPESLRRVVNHARDWNVELGEIGSNDFNWRKLKQPLPAHRTRHASRNEKARLFLAVRKDYRPVVKFALLCGVRLAGLLPKKTDVLWDLGLIQYRKKSRVRETVGYIPITRDIERLLKAEIAKDPAGEHVFTFRRSHKKGAKRYPVTYEGFKSEMGRAKARAGLEDWRQIHDLRHTAATDVLSATGNLAAVRDMLGHSDVAQTERYAHVLNDHVRAAMESRRRR